MYDIDEDDQISINDICDFYRMMYIENYKELLIDNKIQDPNVNKHLMNENVIQKISKEMIENFDLDGDGCLNMNEFRKVEKLTIVTIIFIYYRQLVIST